MGKRTFRLLLIIAVLIGILSVMIHATDNPSATEDMEADDFVYELGQAVITIPGINDETGANVDLEIIATEGDDPQYLLTNENGRATFKDATPENFHIMFEYPFEGVPTVTLRDAKLINGQGHAFRIGRVNVGELKDISYFPCLIMVETDSTISGTYNTPGQPGTFSGIVCDNRNTVTISGPGKLTVTSEGMYPIWMDGYDLILQAANISAVSSIPMSAGVRPAIWVKNADILIDHSVVEVSTNSGPGIWISDSVSGISEQGGERYNITIQNGSSVKVFNPNSKLAAVGCKGMITVSDSMVEIIAKAKCFTSAPIFNNVGTIAGTDRLSAEAYDPEKIDTYNYFLSVVNVAAPNEGGTETEDTPDATEDPSTQETGTPETGSTEETIFETTEETTTETIQETVEDSVLPSTEAVTPTTPAEPTTPQTTPVEPAPSEPDGNHSWIIFAVIGVVIVAAGAIWWFVIRKKVRK